jgi:hypothetical protein
VSGVVTNRSIANSAAVLPRLPCNLATSLLRVSLLFVLSACSSGGGGISGGGVGVTTLPPAVPAPPAVPFTEWSVVGNSGDVILTGSSRESTYTYAMSAGRSVIAPLPEPGGFAPGTTLTESRAPVGGNYSTLRSAAGSRTGGYHDVSKQDPRLLVLMDPWELVEYAWLGNPATLGLNYQSFGTWIEYTVSGGRLDAFTAGVPSNAASVPATGTATYRGFAAGTYIDSLGHAVTATATATSDFAKASIALSLTDTVFPWDSQGAGLAKPNLDLSGTLTSSAGANAFAGPVATKGGAAGNAPMSGTANALFYGPGAAEVGGVFWVTDPGGASYAGGFGAKQ